MKKPRRIERTNLWMCWGTKSKHSLVMDLISIKAANKEAQALSHCGVVTGNFFTARLLRAKHDLGIMEFMGE